MRKVFFFILLALIVFLCCWPLLKPQKGRVSLVFISQPIVVASLEPGKNLTLLALPDNLYLEVPGGLGNYRLGSVYQLGELEEKGGGGELLVKTISNYLALFIDGYVEISTADKDHLLGQLPLLLFKKGKTNLERWRLFKFWWQAERLRQDKIKYISLKETKILKKEKLPDDTEILTTENFRLDELMGKYFVDSQVKKEALKIEILNAAGRPGLAKKMARLVTNLGAEVINVGNYSVQYQTSSIKYQEKTIEKKYTLQKLEKILQVKAKREELGESRADILILVGKDYQ